MLQYCGYPISQYVLRRYGEPFLHSVLAQVQYCEHGDWCEECCFQYQGKLRTNNKPHMKAGPGHRAWVPIPEYNSLKMPLRTFFYAMAYGYKRHLRVHPLCPERRCVNLW